MSRIGRQPVPVPDGVKLTLSGNSVRVEGPLGRLERQLTPGITVERDDAAKSLLVKRASDAKPYRERHGLERTLINNMIVGVTQGYRKELEIVGIGYSARMDGNTLAFQVLSLIHI